MSSNTSLSLYPLLGILSRSFTPHIHLTILISARWNATSLSFLTGQVSLPCNILLHTQLLYNLPLIINDISLLVSNSTNCQNLSIHFEFWALQLHQHLHLHSTCHLNNKTYPLRFALTPVSTCASWTGTGFTQALHTNVFITLYTLPFIPLHFLCTHFWQLVHCIELLPMPLPQMPHGHLTASALPSPIPH